MDSNQKKLEKAFYSDGYRFGMRVADSNNDQRVLFETILEMHNEIDGFIESVTKFAEQQNQQIDCRKGCEWCCHQPVFALDFELDYLNDFINHNFNEQKQNEIKKRAANKDKKLSMLKDTDLLDAKFPCPLLENGACIAYKARPMACRIYLSGDVNSCLKFYQNPGNKNSVPALLNITLRTGQMMNEGFKAALKTKGIKTQEFRIEEKLIDSEYGIS